MATSKTKKKTGKTKADLELISAQENLLIEKEKRYQSQLEKSRRPQVEKLTQLKETRKKKVPLKANKK